MNCFLGNGKLLEHLGDILEVEAGASSGFPGHPLLCETLNYPPSHSTNKTTTKTQPTVHTRTVELNLGKESAVSPGL